MGQSKVVADVVATHNFRGTMKDALVFVAETGSAPRPGAALGAARGAAIAAAGAVGGAAMDKLSADVQAGARRLGQTAGRRIIAFANEQGWLPKPGT
jgi:hypothetical protein